MTHRHPLLDGRFRRLFAAQVVALVGTGLSTVAMTLLAYDLVQQDAALVLGSALACKMLAYVVFAPIVGALAQRLARKPFLIAMDVLRALVVLSMPFVTQVWQIYVLVFVLNLFSAGFKPVFSALIPELLVDESSYTKALSLSRLAYDLENLLSPLLAGVALLVTTYTGLFALNAAAFLVSAGLVLATTLPLAPRVSRLGGVWRQVTFGVVSYLRTPRLRGLLALYVVVACASSMVIVNTVVYVREGFGLGESEVALAFAASGAGSMLVALGLPQLLDRFRERSLMLVGGGCMTLTLALTATGPSFAALLGLWFSLGVGWSLVQTPAGRVVNRSSAPGDRPAYFAAHFALSHACWLVLYPLCGYLGSVLGLNGAALVLAGVGLSAGVLAWFTWPQRDDEVLEHTHPVQMHTHEHVHDQHHQHDHTGLGPVGPEPHSHPHEHAAARHAHAYAIDEHHPQWPSLARR